MTTERPLALIVVRGYILYPTPLSRPVILSLTLCCHRPLNAYVFYTRSTQQSAKAQLIGFLYFGTNLLTSNIRRHSSESPFSTLESSMAPALLTRMSTRPNSSLACRIRPCACSSSVTSHSTESARPPSPFIRSTRSSSRSSRRAATTTGAPSAAKASAVASPMPLDAPVMTATLPSSFVMLASPFCPKAYLPFCILPLSVRAKRRSFGKLRPLAGLRCGSFGRGRQPQVGKRPIAVVEGAKDAKGHEEDGQQDQAGHYTRHDRCGGIFGGQDYGRD